MIAASRAPSSSRPSTAGGRSWPRPFPAWGRAGATGRRGAEAMDLVAGDDRREQGAVVIQAVDSGRQIVAELFSGMVLDETKVSALLTARSRIMEQWGKAQHAGLVIGQTLLHLSRT